MHRLYLQIYLAVLAVLVVLSLLIGAAFWHLDRDQGLDRWLEELTSFAEAILPPADAPIGEARRVLEAFSEPLELDLSLYDPEGGILLSFGRAVPPPPAAGPSQWISERRGRRTLALALSDGRWLVIESERRRNRPVWRLFVVIALLGLATAVVAFPLTRRLTRRLETLKTHVEALGEGHLGERVPVEGRDEIAQLAQSFNATADQIEALVSDKTRLLANTSHELRTPLTRVRMALELLRENPRPELFSRIDRDIEELDDLIGELLIASRLDAQARPLDREAVDLLALAAEEAARRGDIEVMGIDRLVMGDPRLLRRLVRNLIENALRHGESPVEIHVSDAPVAGRVQLVISDCGPGLPDSERERIFEPFYRPPGQASAKGGIGLGLALVRQIAERHGGSIRCETRAGGGTRFVLELPATSAPTDSPARQTVS
jgi:signal transduction histidine kinase